MPDVFAGRFELVDPIGTGATGVVWRAWDRRHRRWCAAKVLRQRDAGALLRFVREQGLRLTHPNVLSPYGWAADDDQALLAMDLVGGGALSTLIADFGPLPERYAAGLLDQLLTALDHIHDTGVVHRDVKPANLLLEATGTDDPVLRLSDFGIALSLGEPRLTRHGTVVGTPGYLAPEILAGGPPSVGQDLYAAGVTAWQLLTGTEPPARGILDPPATDSALWQIIRTLVDPDPDLRAGSAAAALEALKPVLAMTAEQPARTPDGEPIEVFDHLPPLPPTPHPPPAKPHHPAAHSAPPSSASPTTRPSTTRTPSRVASPRPTPPTVVTAPTPDPTGPPTPALTSPTAPRSGATDPAAGVSAASTADPATSAGAAGGRDARGAVGALGPADASAVVAGRGATGADEEGQRRGAGRLAVVVAAVVAVAGIGIGGYLWLDDPERGGGGGTPTGPPSGGASVTTSEPTGGPTASSSPRPPEENVKVGGACGWQQAGSQETAADGTHVECRRRGTDYLWIKIT